MRAGRRAPLARNRPIFLSALLVFDFFYFLKVFYFFPTVFRVRQIFLYACARESLGSVESFETR